MIQVPVRRSARQRARAGGERSVCRSPPRRPQMSCGVDNRGRAADNRLDRA